MYRGLTTDLAIWSVQLGIDQRAQKDLHKTDDHHTDSAAKNAQRATRATATTGKGEQCQIIFYFWSSVGLAFFSLA